MSNPCVPSDAEKSASTECENRRVSVRYLCTGRPWLIRLLAKPSFRSVRAIVQDISKTGLRLALGSKIPTGSVLAIEFSNPRTGYSGILSGRVVHATPMPGGSWQIGCQLARPLSDEDFRLLLNDSIDELPLA